MISHNLLNQALLGNRENAAERQAKRKGTTYQPSVKREMRWGYWTQMKAEEALSHLKNVVFPGLVELADVKSSFGEYMKGAQCKINKAGLLIEACNLIDQMKIAEQNQDVQGDTSAGSVQVCMSICWGTCSLRGAADSSARRGILSA